MLKRPAGTSSRIRYDKQQRERLRDKLEARALKASKRQVPARVVPIKPETKPSQTGLQINHKPIQTGDLFISRVMSQQVAAFELYEMTPKEVAARRIQLYTINKQGKYRFYTRYIDKKYLMVWRME